MPAMSEKGGPRLTRRQLLRGTLAAAGALGLKALIPTPEGTPRAHASPLSQTAPEGDVAKVQEGLVFRVENLPNGGEEMSLANAAPRNFVLRRGAQMRVVGAITDESGIKDVVVSVEDPLRQNSDGGKQIFEAAIPFRLTPEEESVGQTSFSSIVAVNGREITEDQILPELKKQGGGVGLFDSLLVDKEKMFGVFFIDKDPLKKNPDGSPTLHANPVVSEPPSTIAYAEVRQSEDGRVLAYDSNRVPIARAIDLGGRWRWVETESLMNNYSLRELASRIGLEIGCEINGVPLNRGDLKWKILVGNEFNLATLNYGITWRAIEPQRGEVDFSILNRQIAFVKQNDMKARGFHLIFPQYVPDWVMNGDFSKNDLIDIMRARIIYMMDTYKGRVSEWSVVNEPYLPNHPTRSKDPFYKAMGPEYVDLAFQTARETDPSATLIYNDTLNHTANGLTTRLTQDTVRRLRSKGLIDRVGLQMHLKGDVPPSKTDVIATMRSYGIEVTVTEFDVDMTNVTGTEEERFKKQAEIYQSMLEAALESGVCHSFNFWAIGDNNSWLERGGRPDADPTMFDDNLDPKPAYYAVRDALAGYLAKVVQK